MKDEENPTGSDNDAGERWARFVLAAAVALALVLCCLLFGRALQDDAYISFVYARNFARGAGFVYNAGEPAVEGYSNFLWTAIVGLAMKLGLAPSLVSQVLGIACALGMVVMTERLGRRLGAPPFLAAAGALVLASRQTLIIEAVGGLETTFFGLALSVSVWLRLAQERGQKREIASGLTLAAAALTRPEGVLVFGLLEIADLVASRRRGEAPAVWLRSLLPRVLPFVAVVGTHLVWRYATYGDFVPNTAHVKVSPSATILEAGLVYCGRAVLHFGPVLFFLPYLLPGKVGERRGRWTCLLVSTVYVAYVTTVGGDFKPTFRYLLPVIPLWCALAAAATGSLGSRVPSVSWLGGKRWASVAFLLLAGGHTAYVYGFERGWTPQTERSHRQLVAAGEKLNELLPEDAWIAVCNAGRIPYHADRRTLDMLGLNDGHIALVPVKPETAAPMIGHMKGDGRYVLERAPDAILFLSLDLSAQPLAASQAWREITRQRAFGTSEKEILADPRFGREYRAVSVAMPELGGFLNLFARVELAAQLGAAGAIVTSTGF